MGTLWRLVTLFRIPKTQSIHLKFLSKNRRLNAKNDFCAECDLTVTFLRAEHPRQTVCFEGFQVVINGIKNVLRGVTLGTTVSKIIIKLTY